MKKMTEENLKNAFAEQIHATNHLRPLSGIGNTDQNLLVAIEGEAPDICPICGSLKEKFTKF